MRLGIVQTMTPATCTGDGFSQITAKAVTHDSLNASTECMTQVLLLQALHQGLAIVLTLTIAIVGGLVAATAVKVLTPETQKLKSEHIFDDGQWWDEIQGEDDAEPVL